MSGNLIFSNFTLGTSIVNLDFSLKIHLVMKTALFKLLNQTIIPRYTTNYNIKSPLFK